jgi:single stranded DNA-binding protein
VANKFAYRVAARGMPFLSFIPIGVPHAKILIIGYLGRDPELKYGPQGAVVAQFSIASTERWKDKNGELQERTEWFGVKAFGRRAEIAGEYLHKGSPRVFGRPQAH